MTCKASLLGQLAQRDAHTQVGQHHLSQQPRDCPAEQRNPGNQQVLADNQVPVPPKAGLSHHHRNQLFAAEDTNHVSAQPCMQELITLASQAP